MEFEAKSVFSARLRRSHDLVHWVRHIIWSRRCNPYSFDRDSIWWRSMTKCAYSLHSEIKSTCFSFRIFSCRPIRSLHSQNPFTPCSILRHAISHRNQPLPSHLCLPSSMRSGLTVYLTIKCVWWRSTTAAWPCISSTLISYSYDDTCLVESGLKTRLNQVDGDPWLSGHSLHRPGPLLFALQGTSLLQAAMHMWFRFTNWKSHWKMAD